MTPDPIDKSITAVNARLKAARFGLKVERRGGKLSLRGTLPPKPDSSRPVAYQQRIPLGLPANKMGLKKIEKTATIIAAQLIEETFDWQNYIEIEPAAAASAESPDLAAQIEAFKIHFFESRQGSLKPASVRSTWTTGYEIHFNKLKTQAAKNPRLSIAEVIYAAIETTTPNTATRKRCCMVLDAFAKFLDLPLPTPLKLLQGDYGQSKVKERTPPSDEEIISAYKLIPSPAWRFVYGIMATYGLRNHEVFFCDYSNLANGDENASITVLESTKTGGRVVYPFPPEWINTFNLREVILPNINTDLTKIVSARVGGRVSTQFKRYGLPFAPYNLRHAYAIRIMDTGLPDAISARLMGHSVAMLNKNYRRWIQSRDVEAAVERVRKSMD